MKLRLRNMDDNTFIFLDDKKIKVYDMGIITIEEIINWLRENESSIRFSILETMQEYLETAPEDKARICEMEMKIIEEISIDEFLILAVKPYKKMLERYANEIEKIKEIN